ADIEQHAEIGMVERTGGARLALETLQRDAIAGQRFGHEFYGHGPAQAAVFGFVDHAHAALADGVEDAVVRNRFAGHRSGYPFSPGSSPLMRRVFMPLGIWLASTNAMAPGMAPASSAAISFEYTIRGPAA